MDIGKKFDMKKVKTYVNCKLCKKELLETSFSNHLKKHYDPKSSLCSYWYKEYFTNDRGVTVCKLCDCEIHPEYPTSKLDYEEHLKKHNITISKETIQ